MSLLNKYTIIGTVIIIITTFLAFVLILDNDQKKESPMTKKILLIYLKKILRSLIRYKNLYYQEQEKHTSILIKT
ncbi:hypothetical protein RBH29_17130 [Herbivorax sp. ANBcel31]|uniref:hypothetical protein n=1 Tax=Herbivorax sp. ANBcel31 TaxID=3069754 RepID=UPI0027B16A9D|nr:hypothetical protein [Herbivorax sp. ANBcel31]MDQ2088151.1 hypothetical protein [Herbivorax sp. ANBcel31]